jgi:hypothetical protein
MVHPDFKNFKNFAATRIIEDIFCKTIAGFTTRQKQSFKTQYET